MAQAATVTHVDMSSHIQVPTDKKRSAVGELELAVGIRNLRSRVIEPSLSSSLEVSSPVVEPSWAFKYFRRLSRKPCLNSVRIASSFCGNQW